MNVVYGGTRQGIRGLSGPAIERVPEIIDLVRNRGKCLDDLLDHGKVEDLIPAEIVSLAERHRNEAGAAGLEDALEFLHRGNEPVLIGFRIRGISSVEHRVVQADMLNG